MFKLIQKFAWIATALLLVAFLFAGLSTAVKKPQKITLNDLALKIDAEEVQKMNLSDNVITAELKNGDKVTAIKESGAGIIETLKNYGVDPEKTRQVAFEIEQNSAKSVIIGVIIPTLIPIIVIVALSLFLMKKFSSGTNQAMMFGKANIHLFANLKEKISFKDVAGLKEAKQELIEVVDFLKNPKKYIDLGAKIPRGVLLMGPPGTGKTLLARAVAGEAGVPFFHISASEFVEMFVGVGASRTRDAFKTAKQAAPSILFIDEIDAVGRERGSGLGGGHDEREQTLNQILVEMDGFDREENVIVLAATNRPDVLDPALLRPGRFDRRVVLDMPDIAEREEILSIHSKNKPLEDDISLRKVAERTPGFSGADLANLANEAAILAAQQDKNKISQQDIMDSIEKVLLGPARKSKIISDKERKITAYHEAGHALVGAAMPESDPVHKISIVSRGRTGGYTMRLPLEDQSLKTKRQFIADLATIMGGRASEAETFDDISTGASEDLKRATELARNLVMKYGMSDKMGQMTFGDTEEAIFLGREITTEKNYSEKTAAEIDSEVRRFIDEAYEKARSVLKEYKEALQKTAEALIEKETLEQKEFYDIVGQYGLKERKK
ncbi:MAG: ATP-dependent zinc metalloprotease FtsH [Candidatus Colwellbacteria bacterium]|nr:ATP-dependent zinc metalloprotease FtsH [Candidatus Colwellbacteria bacterium]